MPRSRTWCLTLLALLACPVLRAQDTAPLIENRGQWPTAVTHRAELRDATVWIERGAILIDRFDGAAMEAVAHAHVSGERPPVMIRHHAFRMELRGARESASTEATGVKRGTYHYIHGNDPARRGRNCHAFSAVVQHDVLPGIDLRVRAMGNRVKYDLIVAPGADPAQIAFSYVGVDSVHHDPDRLTLFTSLGTFTERIPLAYQEIGGVRSIVPCTYTTRDGAIGFDAGPYDHDHPLIIDPTLVFSTYSGSFANNFGYTATFDRDGFLYSGSSAFGQGYPITLGAYQTTHAGGDGLNDGIDIALSKYDTTGTFLVWSTYLGGSSDELPHSLVVNDNDELFVYGTTSSLDFPTTAGAFDTSFNGGTALNLTNGLGASYPNGADIIVARLSADGSNLLASTYFGGNANDGMNTAAGLKFNYADEIRGEVLLDANDNVYIASSTASNNLPTTANTLAPTYGGGPQDGVLLKLDADLANLFWCTYFGGSQADAVYNIELSSTDGLYIAGGTRSPDLPVSANAFQSAFQGGTADGFVAEVATDGTATLACTYFGSGGYDQCYFADLDQNGDIFLFGQTQATAGQFVVNATYGQPNAGQFIAKLDPALTTILIGTRFGQGDGQPDISPTAFLVDYCNKIYVSGWGSAIQGGTLSTTGLPVTADAFQTTTDGNDFYLAVLDIDLSALFYATYFGGGVSSEHVDGGTSRFDRRGRVYQSACAGCGGNSDLPIQPMPGAVSATNNSGACNNAVFKFDMGLPVVVADFNSTVNCLPAPVAFTNTSHGASGYEWSFGDGTTSTLANPAHNYATPGLYTVQLVATHPDACNQSDTTYRQVVVLGAAAEDLPDTTVCAGGSVQIGLLPIAAPGISYQWAPGTGLSNANVANPIATPSTSTTYTLTVSNGTCNSVMEQTVNVHDPRIDAGADRTLCGPDAQTTLMADGSGGIASFQWSSTNAFSDTLNTTPQDSTANVTMTNAGWFFVLGIRDGCRAIDSVFIHVELGAIALNPTEPICNGDTATITLSGADGGSSILWYPEDHLVSGQGTAAIRVAPPTSTTYSVEVTSPFGCIWNADAEVVVSPVIGSSLSATATPSILIGSGTSQLEALPAGLQYGWTPAQPLDDPTIRTPTATITTTTLFTVAITDGICTKDASVLVEVRELICDEPDIFVPNTFTPNGDGQNDILFVRGRNIASLEFLVFDRWGELVFTTNDAAHGWDGTFQGRPVDPAVFVYHLTAYCLDGQRYFTKGNVTVVR